MQEVVHVDIQKIIENPYQPRRHFAPEELEELARSIQSVGLIQPPVVRAIKEGQYELISGERRFRAAVIAGMKIIPVIVNCQGNELSAEMALIENIQRVDLNPLEIAKALRRLIVDYGLNQEELAKRIGKKRSTVANYLRLLSLPHDVQESLQKNEISMGHAKALLSLESFEKQLALHTLIKEQELSVRETEDASLKMDNAPLKRRLEPLQSKDCFIQDLEERLQQKLGTKVNIQSQGKRGTVTINYYSLDDLDRLLEILG